MASFEIVQQSDGPDDELFGVCGGAGQFLRERPSSLRNR